MIVIVVKYVTLCPTLTLITVVLWMDGWMDVWNWKASYALTEANQQMKQKSRLVVWKQKMTLMEILSQK